MLHHKENLGYKIKSGSNKKLKAPNCGNLYFLAHKPDPVFVAEKKLKVIKNLLLSLRVPSMHCVQQRDTEQGVTQQELQNEQ